MSSLNKDSLKHDALPPPVDFSQASPSLRLQLRGLARKTLSYHRRQYKTNIFCLVVWPILIVVAAFALASSSETFFPDIDLRYCVNEADIINDFKFNPLDPQEDFHTGRFIKLVDNKINAACRYTPSPAGTWFNLSAVLWENPVPPVDGGLIRLKNAVGQFPNVTLIFVTPPDAIWPPTDPSVVYMTPNNTVSTLLGNIPVRYTNQFIPSKASSPDDPAEMGLFRASRFLPQPDAAAMDKIILEMVTRHINPPPMPSGREFDVDAPPQNLTEFEGDEPFGGLFIESVDLDQMRLKMTMQMAMTPSTRRSYTPRNSQYAGLRQMITMSQMTSSLMKHKFGTNFTITQGLRIMPYVWSAKVMPNTGLNEISASLFPFGLAFLLPTIVWLLVQEKEDRHRMMMAMNGLRGFPYYLAHYIEFMCMQFIISLIFALAALAIKSEFISRTNPGFLIVMFLVWAHTQTTFAFFIASFFSRARKASLMVYFFVAFSCIAGSLTQLIFKEAVPVGWSIHPLFAFFRIIQIGIMQASLINGLLPLSFRDITPGTAVFNSIMIMLGESVIFMILTGYIDAVLPSEYGVTRPWHFPITMWFKSSASTAAYDPEAIAMANQANQAKHLQGAYDVQRILVGADSDVYAERDRVESG
ncbi:hypothetical protein DFQ26_000319, partial [Actinomortierella ambigua]